jgi:hypothetical protein
MFEENYYKMKHWKRIRAEKKAAAIANGKSRGRLSFTEALNIERTKDAAKDKKADADTNDKVNIYSTAATSGDEIYTNEEIFTGTENKIGINPMIPLRGKDMVGTLGITYDDFKEEVEKLYTKYNPAKVDEIPTILQRLHHKEDELLFVFYKKYNVAEEERRFIPRLQDTKLFDKLVAIYDEFNPEKISAVGRIMVTFKGRTLTLLEALYDKYNVNVEKRYYVFENERNQAIADEVTQVLTDKAPDRLYDIAAIFETFKNREEEMLNTIYDTYKISKKNRKLTVKSGTPGTGMLMSSSKKQQTELDEVVEKSQLKRLASIDLQLKRMASHDNKEEGDSNNNDYDDDYEQQVTKAIYDIEEYTTSLHPLRVNTTSSSIKDLSSTENISSKAPSELDNNPLSSPGERLIEHGTPHSSRTHMFTFEEDGLADHEDDFI